MGARTLRQDSRASSEGAGNTDQSSWEFRSALEAPIARLESLDELEGSSGLPVRKSYFTSIIRH